MRARRPEKPTNCAHVHVYMDVIHQLFEHMYPKMRARRPEKPTNCAHVHVCMHVIHQSLEDMRMHTLGMYV